MMRREILFLFLVFTDTLARTRFKRHQDNNDTALEINLEGGVTVDEGNELAIGGEVKMDGNLLDSSSSESSSNEFSGSLKGLISKLFGATSSASNDDGSSESTGGGSIGIANIFGVGSQKESIEIEGGEIGRASAGGSAEESGSADNTETDESSSQDTSEGGGSIGASNIFAVGSQEESIEMEGGGIGQISAGESADESSSQDTSEGGGSIGTSNTVGVGSQEESIEMEGGGIGQISAGESAEESDSRDGIEMGKTSSEGTIEGGGSIETGKIYSVGSQEQSTEIEGGGGGGTLASGSTDESIEREGGGNGKSSSSESAVEFGSVSDRVTGEISNEGNGEEGRIIMDDANLNKAESVDIEGGTVSGGAGSSGAEVAVNGGAEVGEDVEGVGGGGGESVEVKGGGVSGEGGLSAEGGESGDMSGESEEEGEGEGDKGEGGESEQVVDVASKEGEASDEGLAENVINEADQRGDIVLNGNESEELDNGMVDSATIILGDADSENGEASEELPLLPESEESKTGMDRSEGGVALDVNEKCIECSQSSGSISDSASANVDTVIGHKAALSNGQVTTFVPKAKNHSLYASALRLPNNIFQLPMSLVRVINGYIYKFFGVNVHHFHLLPSWVERFISKIL